MQYDDPSEKRNLGITFAYVTHDQEEALTMSDTIVVMNQGYIQQIGTLFTMNRKNAFVADSLSVTVIALLKLRW